MSMRARLRKGSTCCLAAIIACTSASPGAWAHGNDWNDWNWNNNGHGHDNGHGNNNGNGHGNGNGNGNNQSKLKSIFPSPTNRYMKDSVTVCDQGSFFVGGALKATRYQNSSTPSAVPSVIMIGQMYVQFQIPAKYDSYPIIFVSGGAHTGAGLESTPDAREGWAHHTLRRGIPVFNVDQSGRGRSGFDASVIHEGVAKLTDADPSNDAEGRALIPNFLTLGVNTWTLWFGHLVNPQTGLPTNGTADPYVDQLVPHGWSKRDPDTTDIHAPGAKTQFPLDYWTKLAIPEGLVPKGEQLSTDFAGPKEAYLLNYYRQLVPNSEQTLPNGTCAACNPHLIQNGGGFGPGHTWSPVALAELVEGLGKSYGGAVVATHSQGGPVGNHLIRILKQHGTLGYLKGLVTVEGTAASLENIGVTAQDLDNLPYLVVKGDYSTTSQQSQDIVNALIARRKMGRGKAAVEYIKLDEAPSKANAWPSPLKRPIMPGITHMMMLTSDQGYGYDSNDIMDMILDWSDKNIPKMKKKIVCEKDGHDDDNWKPRW